MGFPPQSISKETRVGQQTYRLTACRIYRDAEKDTPQTHPSDHHTPPSREYRPPPSDPLLTWGNGMSLAMFDPACKHPPLSTVIGAHQESKNADIPLTLLYVSIYKHPPLSAVLAAQLESPGDTVQSRASRCLPAHPARHLTQRSTARALSTGNRSTRRGRADIRARRRRTKTARAGPDRRDSHVPARRPNSP